MVLKETWCRLCVIGLKWPRLWYRGGFLWTWYWTFVSTKRGEILDQPSYYQFHKTAPYMDGVGWLFRRWYVVLFQLVKLVTEPVMRCGNYWDRDWKEPTGFIFIPSLVRICHFVFQSRDGRTDKYKQLAYRASKKKQCECMLHTKDSVSIFRFLRKSMILPEISRRSLFRIPLRSITLVTLLCGLAPRCKYRVAMTTVFILRSAGLWS
jgi:hypothetical protein